MIHDNAPTKKIKTEKKPRKITERYLHNAGLYYLERFAVSSAHFKTIMSRKINRSCAFHTDQNKESCLAMLDRLILKFQNLDLLNDSTYARACVQSLRRKGLSSRMIHMKLQSKGLDYDIITEALKINERAMPHHDAEILAALRLTKRKRIGAYALQDAQNHKKEQVTPKTLGVMARAGFSYEIAIKVLTIDQNDADDIINTAYH